jgi:hypothetical protein
LSLAAAPQIAAGASELGSLYAAFQQDSVALPISAPPSPDFASPNALLATATQQAVLLQQHQPQHQQQFQQQQQHFQQQQQQLAHLGTDSLLQLLTADADADYDDSDSLSDLGAVLVQQSAVRSMHTAQDSAAELQHRLLRIAAGFYGEKSLQALSEIQGQLSLFNAQQRACGQQGLTFVSVSESWFLRRSVLHLLVSSVRVWGIGGDEEPIGLSDSTRQQLLEAMCGESSALEALLDLRNRNQATPWFTAAHFGNLPTLEWLIGRPELTWKRMLHSTKRGEQAGTDVRFSIA